MKVKIPDKYLSRFSEGKIYISRWPRPKNSLILMNVDEHNELVETLKRLSPQNNNKGFIRFLEAGMIECNILGSEVELPDHFDEYVENSEIYFERGDSGLVISSKI